MLEGHSHKLLGCVFNDVPEGSACCRMVMATVTDTAMDTADTGSTDGTENMADTGNTIRINTGKTMKKIKRAMKRI